MGDSPKGSLRGHSVSHCTCIQNQTKRNYPPAFHTRICSVMCLNMFLTVVRRRAIPLIWEECRCSPVQMGVLGLQCTVRSDVLGSCLSTWHKLEAGKRVVSGENDYYIMVGKTVVHFLDEWLTWESPSHCGQCHPWAGDSGVYKK